MTKIIKTKDLRNVRELFLHFFFNFYEALLLTCLSIIFHLAFFNVVKKKKAKHN